MSDDSYKRLLLLVEDSEDDAFFLMRAFEKSGIHCGIHHVLHGASAIEFLRNASISDSLPHLILLDLKMPVVNGFEVLDWLKKQRFASQVPVIVISGSAQQEDKDQAFQLGAVDYLTKPATAEDFLRLLRFFPDEAKENAAAETGAQF